MLRLSLPRNLTWYAVGVARLAGEQSQGEPGGRGIDQFHLAVLHEGRLTARDRVAEGGQPLPLPAPTTNPAQQTNNINQSIK